MFPPKTFPPPPLLLTLLLLLIVKAWPLLFFNWFIGGPLGMLAAKGFCGVGELLIPTPEGVKAKGFAPPPPPPASAPLSPGVDFFSATKESRFTKEELTPRKSSGDRDLAAALTLAPPLVGFSSGVADVVSAIRGADDSGVVIGEVAEAAAKGVALTTKGSSSSIPNPSMLKASLAGDWTPPALAPPGLPFLMALQASSDTVAAAEVGGKVAAAAA